MYPLLLPPPHTYMQAEPLDGKIEKIYAWRWVTLPRPSAAGGGDDSVMTVGEGGSPTKKTPKGSTTCRFREFFVKWEGKSHWKNSWIDEIRVRIFVYHNYQSPLNCVVAGARMLHYIISSQSLEHIFTFFLYDMILVYPSAHTHYYSLMFTSRSNCVRTCVLVIWRLRPLWTSLPTSSEDTRDAAQPPIKTHRWRSWR